MYLARGKDKDSDETCWEKSDPVGLVNYINDAVEKERNVINLEDVSDI